EFPEKNWETWYKKLNDTDFFYFYIYDKDIDEYVGSVDFHKIKDNEDYIGNNNDKNDYAMGIVIYSKFRNKGYMRPSMKLLIEKAKELNVKKLINAVTVERKNALRVFYELGFKKTDTFSVKKFKKPIDCEKIELTLDK
ncbi:MAG: GNAT family N-acetyltransferase, partial [Clostridia bacterium]|nr:GNAT family N-acetyltransferase [Clostridia bacterium]